MVNIEIDILEDPGEAPIHLVGQDQCRILQVQGSVRQCPRFATTHLRQRSLENPYFTILVPRDIHLDAIQGDPVPNEAPLQQRFENIEADVSSSSADQGFALVAENLNTVEQHFRTTQAPPGIQLTDFDLKSDGL